MGRTSGTYTLTSNIEPKVGAPLDARTIVKLLADLTANNTFEYPYKGMMVFVEENTKTYTLIGTDPTVSANWVESGASQVQTDWNQSDNTKVDYIKNKPENLVQDANYVHTDNNYDNTDKGKVDALGTASTKNVPTTGDASNSEVVLGNDSRLSDSRPANDVSSWAKASTKPTYTASEVGAIASTLKGAVNGVAELDANGLVPSSQLPSYVDDIIEVADYDHLPISGESGKIYVTLDTNKTYRWSGSGYTEVSPSLALGETSSTAYRGDRGKTAYNHSQDSGRITSAVSSGLYKFSATAQGHISGTTAVQKSDITALGIPESDTNTTYTFENGTNGFKVTPSGGTAQTVTVTPSITNNVTGSGTNGYLTKFNGTNTVTNGPQLGSSVSSQTQSTKFLREDGTWAAPSYTTDTNNAVTQTNLANTETGAKRLLLSNSANDTSETKGVYKNTQLQFTPSTGKLATPKLDSKVLAVTQTGTGTAAQDKGSGVSPRYFPAKWTFNLGYSPSDGDIINITLPCAGHGWGDWISIDNGVSYHPANTGGTGRLTTHYGVGTTIQLVFDADGQTNSMTPVNGADSVNGSNITGGCWRVVNYYDTNSNNYDRNLYNVAIKCGSTAIVAGNIIVGKDGVFHHLKDGTAFDINYPILYANGAIAANATSTNNYDVLMIAITTTQSITLTAYLPLFIKGTLSGNIFTPVSTTPLTQTVPTTADGYHYMLLGVAYSTTNIYLDVDHRIFAYKNGKFGEVVNDAESVNGYTVNKSVPSNAVFTDNNTTYTFANGTNGFTVTPSDGSAQTVTVTPDDSTKVPKRKDGYLYNPSLSAYWTSGGKYIRITIPKKGQTYTMCALEVSLRAYNPQLNGKLFIHGYWSSSAEWSQLAATIIGDLPSGIQLYGSDKKYIYIYINKTYVTASLNHALFGDNVVNYDLIADMAMDSVSSLPSTYQTGTVSYGLTDASSLNAAKLTGTVPSSCYIDTKNTAGSTDTSSKIFLVGATSQAANPQTYSDNELYVTSGVLTAKEYTGTYQNLTKTGTGTAAQDKGSGVSPRYFPAKWTFNLGITAAEGDVITLTVPVAGHSYGVFLSVNNGTNYYPVNANNLSRLTTQFPVGTTIQVVFDADGTTNDMFALNGGDARTNISGGCWRVINFYDSNSTYNFSGTTFYSGNGSTAEHNANNIQYNGAYYYSSNGPGTDIGASTADGALYAEAHSTTWVGQIAQDYRDGDLFVRGKNNGTWQPWKKILDYVDAAGFNYSPVLNFKFNPGTRKIIAAKSTSSWDSQVYSLHGYTDNVYLTFKPAQTNMAIMIGIDSNPTQDVNYTNIDYCWYIQNNGNANIYESGSSIVSCGAYAVGNEFRIEYSGGKVRYYMNGVLKREVAKAYAVGTKYYMDSSFHGASGSVYDVDFGQFQYNATTVNGLSFSLVT